MLDSVSYLASYGWQGQGKGLREGSLSRPLAIPQKRTLAGLGKDRDEAFPFWDHLFAAAAKTIKIKVSDGDDSEAADDTTPTRESVFLRTTTGILSNRRPILGTPASSGSTTPLEHCPPRLSLLATAKRESARKHLYARFFRGPVLGPKVEVDPPTQVTNLDTTIAPGPINITVRNINGKSPGKKRKYKGQEDITETKKPKETTKTKIDDAEIGVISVRKRKKTQKEPEEAGPRGKSEDIVKMKRQESAEERRQRKADKVERRKRKEERRSAKEERRRAREERRIAKGKTKSSS